MRYRMDKENKQSQENFRNQAIFLPFHIVVLFHSEREPCFSMLEEVLDLQLSPGEIYQAKIAHSIVV